MRSKTPYDDDTKDWLDRRSDMNLLIQITDKNGRVKRSKHTEFLFKRLINKGLVDWKRIGRNQRCYYLTDKGKALLAEA